MSGKLDWDPACSATRSAHERRRPDVRRARQRAVRAEMPWWSIPNFDWRGEPRRRSVPWDRTIIYETHVTRLHQAASRRAREAARHLSPGSAARRSSTTSSRSASPRSSCCRSTPSSTTAICWTRASPTTGATTRSASSRPIRATPPTSPNSSARIQGDGRAPARRRPRGDPRRRLQPHRRRQRARPDAVVQGHRQRLLLPADAGQAALLHQRHRHRQHAQPQPSARACRW